MALSKVMEDKLDMKQFRLFLRTLRMIYNFYEVQKNTYNRWFSFLLKLVKIKSNYSRQCPEFDDHPIWSPPHPDFQLRRLRWDSYNQQRKLPRGGHQVRRIMMRRVLQTKVEKSFLAKLCFQESAGEMVGAL